MHSSLFLLCLAAWHRWTSVLAARRAAPIPDLSSLNRAQLLDSSSCVACQHTCFMALRSSCCISVVRRGIAPCTAPCAALCIVLLNSTCVSNPSASELGGGRVSKPATYFSIADRQHRTATPQLPMSVCVCAAAAKGDMEFVMSMSTSNITPTFQIDPEQQLRIKARYNATVRHTGEVCAA